MYIALCIGCCNEVEYIRSVFAVGVLFKRVMMPSVSLVSLVLKASVCVGRSWVARVSAEVVALAAERRVRY